jgi:hypothetical protein
MSPILDEAYNRVRFDSPIVHKFFISFSLFENSLKKAGYRKVSRRNYIEADWSGFARSIHYVFQTYLLTSGNTEVIDAVTEILNNPPGKQVVVNGNLEFALPQRDSSISETEWLSILIRGVRNNLFHGGKFSYDFERDTNLLTWSLRILEIWSTLDTNVERYLSNII